MSYYFGLLKRLLTALLTADFYRTISKTLWLFFPSFIFLFLCLFAFWNITQGKDLMVYTLEHPAVYIWFFIAILFFAYIIWYSSRLVAKAKFWQNENYLWWKVRLHMPRFLGFSCFTVIILAFLQLEIDESPQMKNGWAWIFLLFSLPYYIFLHRLSNYFVFTKQYTTRAMVIVLSVFAAVALLAVYLLDSFTGLIVLLIILQTASVLYFIIRRRAIKEKLKKDYKPDTSGYGNKKGPVLLWAKLKRLFEDPEEKDSMKLFNPVSIVALATYVATIISVKFSVFIGTFPFVLLAFGVMAGFINLVSTLSVFSRFNFHLVFLIWAFISGKFSEPHSVNLTEKQNPTALFGKRQKLQEYFTNWVKQRYPDTAMLKTPAPVYFVLSDGGASRSGYWVASVLSRLEDSTVETKKFSNNLFCLSGASGGSVGNAAFFNLLRSKNILHEKKISCQDASTGYLGSDFLSYAIARMLGPDFFRYIIPVVLIPAKNRASALTRALEKAPGSDNVLYETFGTGASVFITQEKQPAVLPILCINTTRMQDGRPGVISTINMDEIFFNKRTDVLSLIGEDKDLKLSSAVVLGASFPYISPAGRIDELIPASKKDGTDSSFKEPHYFVDGGYFDNSGAGVVNEMIIAMKQMMARDSFLMRYNNKLDFYVLHITNDPHPGGEPKLEKVNPLINDMAAPLQTLAGAYGSQTSVNDSRLKNYMVNNFGAGHYIPLNLYKQNDKMNFSMNWVISKRTLDSMDNRLAHSEEVKKLWMHMNQ